MIKKPVKIQLSEGLDADRLHFLFRKLVSIQVRYISKLTRSKSMQRALWG